MANIYDDVSWGGVGRELGLDKAANAARALKAELGTFSVGGSLPATYEALAHKNDRATSGVTAPKTPEQPVYAPKGVTSGGMPDKFTAGTVDDIRGAAARINPNADPWRSMASGIAAQSAARVSTDNAMDMAGTNERMARSLGYGGVGDFNQKFDSRPAVGLGYIPQDTSRQDELYGALQSQIENLNKNGGRANASAVEALAGLYKAHMGSGDSRYNTDMQAFRGAGHDQALTNIEAMRGRNQLAAYGMQGDNQLDLERLRGGNQFGVERLRQLGAEGHDARTADLQLGLQRMKNEAEAPERAQRGAYYEASAGLNNKRASQLQEEIDYGKTPQAQEAALFKTLIGSGMFENIDQVYGEMAKFRARRNTDAQRRRQQEQGYADGGQVQMTEGERLMAEMSRKYGAPTGGQQAPQPQAPAPAPAAPQQPRQETWTEKARRIATGGLDRRMQGFASGGPIAVGGRQVLGAGTGKSDSLPAVIDDEQPAALSTGEFVLPVETVQFFGLDRLRKMVAQSRKGLDTERDDA